MDNRKVKRINLFDCIEDNDSCTIKTRLNYNTQYKIYKFKTMIKNIKNVFTLKFIRDYIADYKDKKWNRECNLSLDDVYIAQPYDDEQWLNMIKNCKSEVNV